MPKKKEEQTLTRAQKTEATKTIIKELLAVKPMRHNELIDEVAKTYATRYAGEDTENANDVRGRVGSVLDIMKKESEIMYADGAYALKARLPMPPQEKVKKTAKKVRAVAEEKTESVQAESKEEPVPPKKRGRKAKSAEPVEEKAVAPIAETPVEEKPAVKKTRTKKTVKTPVVDEKKEETPVEVKTEEKTEKKSAPKKRTVKAKKEETSTAEKVEIAHVAEEKKEPVAETPVVEAKKEEVDTAERKEEKKEERREIIVAPKAEVAQKGVVMDMSFLFGDKTPKSPQKQQEKPQEKKAPVAVAPTEKKEQAPQAVAQTKAQTTPVQKPQTQRTEEKGKPVERTAQPARGRKTPVRATQNAKIATADDKLKDSFLKKLRTLGGDYFEYYSVYLLERYSMKNGRRLEGLKISGGDHDGGIDGEIEVTDKLGFRETIYIQSKNWDPEKGKEEKWVVGETLLQQFIGACACRQAKDGKQRVRGIFITTSRFTPEAKNILDAMSDTIVGYDGTDLYEAAKECQFGLIYKNGEWSLDERLLSGTKAFFQML